eukprot:m.131793 g.131793  ORF g.131793 m.131793 type:complete len:196 (+) comp17481_c0_seq5:2279-2866(+)
MPTGGDWALQRSGAILFEGTERSTVDGCYMHHVDGNGIFLSNYNLNATVSNNEMSWIGDSAIAAWGSTGTCLDAACSQQVAWGVGPDARNRNQPLGTHVVGNLVRELGIWQKQSSFWFQAATAFSHIERNVHFNGPRAGVNFNDQMQGGDVIEGRGRDSRTCPQQWQAHRRAALPRDSQEFHHWDVQLARGHRYG